MRQTMLFCAVACLIGVVQAADDKSGKSTGGDQTFVMKASAGGMAEVKAGELAVKNASMASVKKFAQQMVDDHTKANKELSALAEKKGYKIAKKITMDQEKMASRLMKARGGEFDREYVAGQVKDHEATIALFEKEAESGSDEELKAWAKKTLPTIRHHLKMAKELNDTVGNKSTRRDR